MKQVQHVHFHKMLEAIVRDVKSYPVSSITLADTTYQRRVDDGVLVTYLTVDGKASYPGNPSLGYVVEVEGAQRRFFVDIDTFRRTPAEVRAEYPSIYRTAVSSITARAKIGEFLLQGKCLAQIEAAFFPLYVRDRDRAAS